MRTPFKNVCPWSESFETPVQQPESPGFSQALIVGAIMDRLRRSSASPLQTSSDDDTLDNEVTIAFILFVELST